MDEEARRLKKQKEAERLRAVPPEVTLRAGFEMMVFARRLREAAERARP